MFDVAIIGCGPVGAFAANLLGKSGLSVLVIEKEANPYPLPRAVHLDHEMMRLFQSAGVSDRVAADMRDTEGHLHVGADHGVIRYMGTVGVRARSAGRTIISSISPNWKRICAMRCRPMSMSICGWASGSRGWRRMPTA